jgi:peptide/nickel transport system permease protein
MVTVCMRRDHVSVRAVAVRILGALVVVVLSTAAIWLTLHVLRPEAFRGDAGLAHYLDRAFLHFDLGLSRTLRRPVADVVRESVPADLQLLLGGVIVGLVLGIAGGLYSAARPSSALTHALHVVAMIGVCAPVYVVGLLMLLLFGHGIARTVDLGIPLTYTGFGESPVKWLHSMVVPWLVVGFPIAGAALRMMRAQAIEVRGEDYLRTARAKGLSERAVFRRHVLRPSLAPVIAMVGATANATLLNMVLVERAFSVPGVFEHLTDASNNGDFPLLFALTIVGAVIVCASNVAADLMLMVIDPRIRR